MSSGEQPARVVAEAIASGKIVGVAVILDPLGFRLCSSSLSGFAPMVARRAVFADAAKQASLSRRRNLEEGRFFPGFFTALYKRRVP